MGLIQKIFARLSVVPLRYWLKHAAALIEIRTQPDSAARGAYQAFMEKRKGMSTTTDWLGRKSYFWYKYLSHLKDQPFDYLEVGSWEGASACFVAQNFPKARISCVDAWLGADDIQSKLAATSEANFTKNTAFFSERLIKLKGFSQQVLAGLHGAKTYDVMYVDAGHYSDDVMMDALLCWQLLKKNGILIFDDFVWGYDGFPQRKWTNVAVAAFLNLLKGEYEMLHIGHQVFIKRTVARNELVRHA
jgi:predicted O-methyltransferase YrrM